MHLLSIPARAFVLLAVLSLPIGPAAADEPLGKDPDLRAMELMREGRTLSTGEVQALEADLVDQPDQLETRLRLIGYYTFGSIDNRAERYRHVLWIARHRPDSCTGPACQIDRLAGPDVELEFRAIWDEHLEKSPDDPDLLRTVARQVAVSDDTLARECMMRGRELEPDNPYWPTALGSSWGRDATFKNDEEAAAVAFDFLKEGYEKSPEVDRAYLLGDLAMSAFRARAYDEARSWSLKAVAVGKASDAWYAGNCVHHGNVILGRLALRDGDVEEAGRRLLAAADTTGSPQLKSFGPNMKLAQELLEHDQRDVVLDYLERCRSFWQTGQSRLDNWIEVVKTGEVPDFGASLNH